jgi:hypothetical protein
MPASFVSKVLKDALNSDVESNGDLGVGQQPT